MQKIKLALSFIYSIVFFSCFSQSAFIENKGQWDGSILYRSEFNGGKLYIEQNTLNYNFLDTDVLDEYIHNHHKLHHYDDSEDLTIKGHCLKTSFINANLYSEISSESKINEYFNFYLGNDSKKWARKVSAYNKLIFNDIYTNIDLILSNNENGYKYDFLLKPSASHSDIKISYSGAESVVLKNENLYINTSVNEIIEMKPYAYQIINGVEIEVPCSFKLEQDIISFELETYDKTQNLIIDPFIVFSRYSSSFANNFGYTATYDSEENAYGAGSVFSSGYITTPGAYDLSFNGNNTDIGIVKYSSDGLQRIYSTYLGGNDTDLPHSIVVNSRDELFLMGTSSSTNFPIDTNGIPISGVFNGGTNVSFTGLGVSYSNGSDLVIARLKEDGTDLLSSTYLGGSQNDGLNNSSFLKYNYADEIRGEILLDDDDNCYIVSCTVSNDFPIVGGFQTTNAGDLDAVIIKMDENLSTILWSSYYGGSSDDAIYSLDFDSLNNLVVAGGTHSDDFPVVNAFQDTFAGGNSDGFISKIHSSGAGLISSSYYGSTDYDQNYFVELNDFDEVHIFGQTKADPGQLISNAIYNKPNGGQHLAKFNNDIDSLIWATRFGDESGVPDISPTAFLVDVCNRIFLSGWGSVIQGSSSLSGTNGLDVTSDAIDATTDNNDIYFMVLLDDASSLVYGSFFGGNQSNEHVDGGTSRFDKKGIVYQAVCAGCGSNQDFPTIPSDSSSVWTNNNSCNLGVVKYAFSPPSIIADFSLPPTDCAPLNLDFFNQSQTAFNDTSQTEFIWIVNDDTINSYHLNYDFLISGVYNITLIGIDTQSCNFQNETTKQITIIGNGSSSLPDAPLCAGNLVQIGVTPLSEPNITYQWTPDYFLSSTSIANPYANPPLDTTYRLIISNGNCTDTFYQRVVLGSIEVEIDPFDSVCLEGEIVLHATEFTGGIYEWTPEEIILEGQGTSTATVYAENINQEISVMVTNLDGCTDLVTTNLQTINELPEVELFADPDSLESGQSSQLLAISEGAISYLWEPNNHFTSLDITNPLAENITETTTFNIIVDNGICPKKDSVKVYVIIPDCLEGKFYVPNAFSPNDDGNNDIFKVRTTLVNIENFYFAVYDRWGNKVFSTNDKTEGWDGTYKGKKLSPNVYGWYTEGVCPNGEDYLIKGNVTLLK